MVRCANGFTEEKSIKFQGYLSETDIIIDLRHRTCENITRQEKVISSVASVAVEPNPSSSISVLPQIEGDGFKEQRHRVNTCSENYFFKKKKIRTTH